MSDAVLAIDTSGSFCSVAVRDLAGTVYHRTSSGAGDHFEQLSALVPELLRSAGLDAESIREVRVGIGPGSFTGIRIGMSYAKGLAWSLHVPLAGAPSFAGAAASVALSPGAAGADSCQVIGVLADARRSERFVGVYEVRSEIVRCVVEPHIAAESEIVSLHHGVDRWVTPEVGGSALGIDPEVVSSVAIGLLGLTLGEAEAGALGISNVEPSYLRAVAAKTIVERAREEALKET